MKKFLILTLVLGVLVAVGYFAVKGGFVNANMLPALPSVENLVPSFEIPKFNLDFLDRNSAE